MISAHTYTTAIVTQLKIIIPHLFLLDGHFTFK